MSSGLKEHLRGRLQEFSEPALVRAIEINLFELFATFHRWPQAEAHDDPDMLWTITNVPFPLFNSVLRARLEQHDIEAVIEATLRRYKARNVPMLWWTGPTTRPKNLGAYLEAHGFVHEGDSPGMAVDLQTLNENLDRPPGLEIELVNDGESLQKWSEVLTAAFPMPEFVARPMFDFSSALGFGKVSSMHNYCGRLKGEVIATSSLFLGADAAGIYNVGTMPNARGKGVGAAMTLEPLCEARALGYRVGILSSSRLGVGVYRKLGFREYCKIGQYSWTNQVTT